MDINDILHIFLKCKEFANDEEYDSIEYGSRDSGELNIFNYHTETIEALLESYRSSSLSHKIK